MGEERSSSSDVVSKLNAILATLPTPVESLPYDGPEPEIEYLSDIEADHLAG